MTNNYTVSSGFDCNALSLALLNYLEDTKQLAAQHIRVSETEWIVQAREKSSLKKIVGMDKAATVKLNINNTHLKVEIGQGKWIDKMAMNAIAYFLFWPALIPGAIGAHQQMQLPKEISRFISSYINKSSYTTTYPEPTSKSFCPNCGEKMGTGVNFCNKCGTKIN